MENSDANIKCPNKVKITTEAIETAHLLRLVGNTQFRACWYKMSQAISSLLNALSKNEDHHVITNAIVAIGKKWGRVPCCPILIYTYIEIHIYIYLYAHIYLSKKKNQIYVKTRCMSYTEYSLLDIENEECEDLEYKGMYLYGDI